jgi:hypothetical protein
MTPCLSSYEFVPGHFAFEVTLDALILANLSHYALPDKIPDRPVGPQIIILRAKNYDLGLRENPLLFTPPQELLFLG